MHGKIENDLRSGTGVEFLDEQVRRLVDPVLEHRAGELDALAVVPVPREPWPTGIARDEPEQVSDVGGTVAARGGGVGSGHHGHHPRVLISTPEM